MGCQNEFDYYGYIKTKYTYFTDDEIKAFISMATEILMNRLYPYDKSIGETSFIIPKRYRMWILRCITEIIEKQGISSAIGYAENGVSLNFDNTQISNGLLTEITPYMGTVNMTVKITDIEDIAVSSATSTVEVITLPSDAEIFAESSDTSVVTVSVVDHTITLTRVANGTSTITVYAYIDFYKNGETTFVATASGL